MSTIIDISDKFAINSNSIEWCFISGVEQITKFVTNNGDLCCVMFLCDSNSENILISKFPHIAHQLVNVDQFLDMSSNKYMSAIHRISDMPSHLEQKW